MKPERPLHVFYGGTFDPVHDGHVAVAIAARDALGTPIHVLPAADPPHRDPPGASAQARADMLRLAIAGQPGLVLDLRELERGGRSWSVDTLHALRAQLGPEAAIAWVVGADSFRSLDTWREWESLFDLTHFVVAGRAGHPIRDDLPGRLQRAVHGRWIDAPAGLRTAPAGRVLALQQALHAHSATDVRARIAAGLPWRTLVPPAVADYIVKHRLYGVAGAPAVIGP